MEHDLGEISSDLAASSGKTLTDATIESRFVDGKADGKPDVKANDDEDDKPDGVKGNDDEEEKPDDSKPNESTSDNSKPDDKKTDSKKPKREFPTHFVSVQVSNPEVIKALTDVQQAVLTGEENLEKAMVSMATAHFTLMVIRLETEEEIVSAGLALERCLNDHWSNYVQGLDMLELEVAGLGHFDHHVMFAKITPGNHLDQLFKIAESVESCLSEDGITKADPKPFKPHLTLMKFTKDRAKLLRKKGIKRIDPNLYKEFVKTKFGVDIMKSVQLCSMNKPKDKETGYYHIEHEILFDVSKAAATSDVQQVKTSDAQLGDNSEVQQMECSDVQQVESSDVQQVESSDVQQVETSDAK